MTTCLPSPNTHSHPHTQQSLNLASPLICIFWGIFLHKCVLSSKFSGEIEGFASEQASEKHGAYYGSKAAAAGGILVMF